MSVKTCLLVDDELAVLTALRRAIHQFIPELKVEIFTDPKQAFLRSGETPFAVIIADYRMPTMNGATFLGAFKQMQPEAVRVMLSGSSEFETLLDAVNEGEIFRYIAKPWCQADLEKTMRLALAMHDDLIAARQLRSEMTTVKNAFLQQEIEARRLEQLEPGITKVNWGPDGAVHFD